MLKTKRWISERRSSMPAVLEEGIHQAAGLRTRPAG
jgi:hypothetical protein